MRLRFPQRSLRPTVFASLLAALAFAANASSALAADQTVTAVASSVPSPVWGQSVTLTATVTNSTPLGTTPTGTVQFQVDGGNVDTPQSLTTGSAKIAVSDLAVGPRHVVAHFTPNDAQFTASDGELPLTVGRASVNVIETVSPDPTVAGQSATFLATVTAAPPGAGTPTGTVRFSDDDGSPIGGEQELSAGTTSITVPAGAGSYRVHADYSGDGHFTTGSTTVDQTVNKADTITTLTSSANPVAPGGTLQLTALVSARPPGDIPAFGGSMQLTVDGQPLGGPMPLNGGIGVRVTLRAPNVRTTNTIGVAYSGDDNSNPSSASLQQTIGVTGGGAKTSAKQLSDMGSTLIRTLRKRGFAALNGTAERFTAVEPGVLEQKVYSPKAPKSATSGKTRKPIVLATARHAFAAAGAGVLKLRLTAAGRRAIRHAKKLQIAIVTRFTPKTGKAVSVVQRLIVKARKGGKAASIDIGWSVLGAHGL